MSAEEPCDECAKERQQLVFVSVGIGLVLGAGVFFLISRGK
jgi:hypothetical protein